MACAMSNLPRISNIYYIYFSPPFTLLPLTPPHRPSPVMTFWNLELLVKSHETEIIYYVLNHLAHQSAPKLLSQCLLIIELDDIVQSGYPAHLGLPHIHHPLQMAACLSIDSHHLWRPISAQYSYVFQQSAAVYCKALAIYRKLTY